MLCQQLKPGAVMQFKTEEVQRCLKGSKGKGFEVEVCVATTATYGDKFRGVCRHRCLPLQHPVVGLEEMAACSLCEFHLNSPGRQLCIAATEFFTNAGSKQRARSGAHGRLSLPSCTPSRSTGF